jgi:hypothetical protein
MKRFLLACLCLVGCAPKVAPTPSVDTPEVRVPAGCLVNQAGDYVHSDNAAFRYRGEDDGGTLVLALQRDAGAAEVVLHRSEKGFTGVTRASATTASGQTCQVEFPTEITACAESGLTLRAAATTSVDDACRVPPAGRGAVMLEHRLSREVATDGGAH